MTQALLTFTNALGEYAEVREQGENFEILIEGEEQGVFDSLLRSLEALEDYGFSTLD